MSDQNFDFRPIALLPYNQETKFAIPDLSVNMYSETGRHSTTPVYSMNSKKRGVFFFVNIVENRDGAEVDKQNMVTLFRILGYTIFYYENLTSVQVKDLIMQLKKSDYVKDIDSFVMCIAGHGNAT